jgi:hypothetical protein
VSIETDSMRKQSEIGSNHAEVKTYTMPAKRAFISFDFDHDEDLRNLLAGQAKHPDSPFAMQNWSVREAFSGDWKEKVRARIRQTDFTIVICGEQTKAATGVAAEVTITREEGHPYFLIAGRSDRNCTRPTSALLSDKMYRWTWDNLKSLIEGSR